MTPPSLFEAFGLLAVILLAVQTGWNLWKRWYQANRLKADINVLRRGNDELKKLRAQRYVQRSQR